MKVEQVAALGQAIWLDYIDRSLLVTGGLKSLVEDGIRGVTSNPTIFERAIAGSADYREQLAEAALAGDTAEEIYERLVLDDIRAALDILYPVYEETEGLDGYVSLEVDPLLASDTEGTVAEARRLFSEISRPNLLIKVPATPAGIPAIEQLISEGVNVNATLIFSQAHYEATAKAYIRGLERRMGRGEDVTSIASVASLFISRMDTAVDGMLAEREEGDLQGKIGIANTKMIYQRFLELFCGERWEALAAAGARVQRPLWASTSTKNPAYPDTMYVERLIARHTVNTMPPGTLEAFRDHGMVATTIYSGLGKAKEHLARLGALGIDINAVANDLQDEGVEKFIDSFRSLLETIEGERKRALGS
ncbi:MAG: transaldolase [Chloroflexota bacterium]|nr:transaldolase [Chloroflexota bacterium]